MVKIVLTDSDLIDGQRVECRFCPVALAVNRVLRQPYFASVGSYIAINQPIFGLEITEDYDQVHVMQYDASNDLFHVPQKFDAGKYVRTGDYWLDIPQEYLK